MPILLTVPHDGDEMLGWIGVRKKGTVVRDVATRDLAERTANLLEKKTGLRPYFVIAKFSRRYLDANRQEAEAQESPEAIPAYRYYHAQIAKFVAEISAKYSDGAILIDIHGQSDDPETIFRGSRSGVTARVLLNKFGKEALQGNTSITGALQGKGYKVFPPIESPDLREDKRFNGGHTVFTYGSNNPNGIDAIQLEFGKRARDRSNLAEDFAGSILIFSKKYIPSLIR
jgi:N-formylglutamate amidohydrolase